MNGGDPKTIQLYVGRQGTRRTAMTITTTIPTSSTTTMLVTTYFGIWLCNSMMMYQLKCWYNQHQWSASASMISISINDDWCPVHVCTCPSVNNWLGNQNNHGEMISLYKVFMAWQSPTLLLLWGNVINREWIGKWCLWVYIIIPGDEWYKRRTTSYVLCNIVGSTPVHRSNSNLRWDLCWCARLLVQGMNAQ
jgi:hypothetical protein